LSSWHKLISTLLENPACWPASWALSLSARLGGLALDSAEQLKIIRETRGDPALLALATVDLAFPGVPESERTGLRLALEAAAIPHWCDTGILVKLIEGSGSLNSSQWTRLKTLPIMESFPARGADAANVHEASRLAIRKRLAETERRRFTELSIRSARVFDADMRPAGRIEWVYHLLVGDPERGAVELEVLDRAWSATARDQDLAALSVVLAELDTSQILRGRPLVRARLVMAQRRAALAGAASLGDLANQLLQAAEATGDTRLAGDAYKLVGDVAQASGDLTAADQAYTQYRAISERLAALDPANTGWQQDLATAHNRVGVVAQARGDLTAASQAYTQHLAIIERLAAVDLTNTSWQRELAVAHSWVGVVAQTRGDLTAASQAYTQYQAIAERLAAVDPANTSWQRELATAHNLAGGVAQARGDLTAADQAYTQYQAIFERLAALDPANTA
jgi:tetratricopeptide (TPR) repeat protein